MSQESDKLCIVDSGTDRTLVSSDWLADCGDYSKLPDSRSAKSVNADIEIKVVLGELFYQGTRFASILAVSDPGPENPLLGRNDFFQHFAVDFSGWVVNPPYFRADKKK